MKAKRIIGWSLIAIYAIFWVRSIWLSAYESYGLNAVWVAPITILIIFIILVVVAWLIS
jgi:hypothetical protein